MAVAIRRSTGLGPVASAVTPTEVVLASSPLALKARTPML